MIKIRLDRKTSLFPMMDNYKYYINNKVFTKCNNFFHLFPRHIKINGEKVDLAIIQTTLRFKFLTIFTVLLFLLLLAKTQYSAIPLLLFIVVCIFFRFFKYKGNVGKIKEKGKIVGKIRKNNFKISISYNSDLYEIYLHSDNLISVCKNNLQCGLIKLYEYVDFGVFKYTAYFDEKILEEEMFLVLMIIADSEFFPFYSKYLGFPWKRKSLFSPIKIKTRNFRDSHVERKKYYNF